MNNCQLAQENENLNHKEYESKLTTLKSYPTSMFVQIDAPCNQDCIFCSRPESYQYFDLEDFRAKFEEKLWPAFERLQRFNITGSGELLSLPKAKENLKYFNQFEHAEKMFATNGSTLTPKMADFIIESGNRYLIHISMHSCDPLLHKTMTLTNTYHAVKQNVDYIMDAKKATDKLKVNFIFVATTKNIHTLADFVKYAASKGADAVVVYYNFVYRFDQKFTSTYFAKEKTNEMLLKAEQLGKELNIRVQLPHLYNQKEYHNDTMCREAWTQLMINTSGDVITCDAAAALRETILDKKDFFSLWNSPYFIKVRERLLQGTSACSNFCLRANAASINNYKSHFIWRGKSDEEVARFMEGT
jgi:MoaA/NifB/PqqE/SkfB family radical SAM enzyme